MDKTQVENEFGAFVTEVEERAKRLYGVAGNGQSDKAALLALSLWDMCCTTREQRRMKAEVSEQDYDLASLHP